MQRFTCNLHMWSENVLRNFIAWLKADILYTIIASCDSQNQSVFIFSVYILMRLKCKICVVQKPTEVNKHPNCCVWAFLRLFQMMQKINFYLFFKSIFFFPAGMAWSDRSWEICLWRCCHCHLLAGRELLYLIICCKVLFPNNRTSLKKIIL